jgi:hypothetical protein
MSQLVVNVNVEVTTELFDNETHLVCCQTPNDFVGFTTAMCGKTVFNDGVDDNDDEGVECQKCMSVEDTAPCPIGMSCYDLDVEEDYIS